MLRTGGRPRLSTRGDRFFIVSAEQQSHTRRIPGRRAGKRQHDDRARSEKLHRGAEPTFEVTININTRRWFEAFYTIVDFSATVTNLQAKVESLTTTNALMKEDLSIAKNNILSLHEENRQLKKELGIEIKDTNEVRYRLVLIVPFLSTFFFSFLLLFFFFCQDWQLGFLWFQNGKPPIKITETTTEIEELRSRLEAEKKMRQDIEKELELQVDGAIYIYLLLYIYIYIK